MEYTQKQYALMEKLSDGLIYDDLSAPEQEILYYLESEKIAVPNVQIADGYWTLTQEGARALDDRQKAIRAAKIQVQEKLQQLQEQESIRQENIRREQEQERKRREETAAAKADRDAEKRADHKFQIALAIVNSALSFLVGVLVEHFAGIVDWIRFIF